MATYADRLAFIKGETEKWHDEVLSTKKYYRRWAIFVTILVAALSTTASILLGLHSQSDWPRVVSLIMTAIVSFVTIVSAFFGYKDLWIVNDTAAFRLNTLKFHIEYLLTLDNFNEAMVNVN